jgi:4-carboxymuconolactone decarboxylase
MRKLPIALALAASLALPALAEDRFPPLDPAQMTPAQRQVYDAIASGPRGGVRGPFNTWLRSPETGDRLQRVGEHLRFRSVIPTALNEFAILITARAWDAPYEWYAHYPLAVKAGLPEAVAAELAQGKRPGNMTEDQALVYDFLTELHRNHGVSDASFNALKARFSEQGVVDLIAVSGYYVAVAMTLNVAQVKLPDGVPNPLPPLPR